MKKFTIILFLACSLPQFAQAQIQPPEFVCVQGDTLFWNLPTNACGPFVSYDVYASQNIDGPYTLLDSVTDPAQDFFFHLNPSGDQWFYYLESNHDCPGQVRLQSDTLDNRPPEVSPISSLVVTGSDVEVTWTPSPSPEVYAYIVYRETDIGVVPIDTVFGANSYLDIGADPGAGPESYFVNALDRCGNSSIFDAKHTTVFLEGAVVACEQAITLTWNLYENWPNGVGEQQIWAGEQGTMPVQVATLDPTATSFSFGPLTDGLTYCLSVAPVEALTGNRSVSNQVCLTADIVQPANELFLKNVSVTPNDEVEVTWQWNTNAELSGAAVFSAPQNADYQQVGTLPLGGALQLENTFLDANAAAGTGSVFYQIHATDDCGDVQVSTYGATVFLAANAIPGNVNQITWTPFDLENATVTSYDLYKNAGGSDTYLATVDAGTSTFEDPFDPTDLASAQACYYVVAEATVTSPAGVQLPILSRSNTDCVAQKVRIFVPNAFVPDGINQEFKPLIVLGDLASYELGVYDRYGKQVFFSDDPDEGWRGKKDGRKLPQGVYVYRIEVQQANGERAEKRGTVLLLH